MVENSKIIYVTFQFVYMSQNNARELNPSFVEIKKNRLFVFSGADPFLDANKNIREPLLINDRLL